MGIPVKLPGPLSKKFRLLGGLARLRYHCVRGIINHA